jgi:hypothetical protein
LGGSIEDFVSIQKRIGCYVTWCWSEIIGAARLVAPSAAWKYTTSRLGGSWALIVRKT